MECREISVDRGELPAGGELQFGLEYRLQFGDEVRRIQGVFSKTAMHSTPIDGDEALAASLLAGAMREILDTAEAAPSTDDLDGQAASFGYSAVESSASYKLLRCAYTWEDAKDMHDRLLRKGPPPEPRDLSNYLATWALLIKGQMSQFVGEKYPQDIHRWPCVRAFSHEGHVWRSRYLVVVLRDKPSGGMVGGAPKALAPTEGPSTEPSESSVDEWLTFMWERLDVTQKDTAVVVPVVDKPTGTTQDWQKLTDEHRRLFWYQLVKNVERHHYWLHGLDLKTGFFIPPGYRGLAGGLERFFRDHPEYGRNVFIMMRFARGNVLAERIDSSIREVLRSHGMNPVRADDKMYLRDRGLWQNVCVYMLGCKYGIAVLEDRIKDEFNPNVALEYGFMRALDKPALLLADEGFRNLRADIVGTLREHFDITDIEGTIRDPVEVWLRELDLL